MRKTIPSQDLRKEKLRADPTCRQCGVTKTVDDFPKRAVDYSCNDCRRIYARRAYHRKRKSLSPEELEALKAQINERQTRRRREKLTAMAPGELAAYRDKINRENLERRDKVRDTVYQAYGGYRCSCCGESERRFLSIDHINNDGAKHRRANNLNTGEQFYRWIIRNDFPPDYQVLCMNCQWGKRNNNGVCPHQEASGKV